MPKRNPAAGNETPAKTANFRADSSPQAQQTKPVLDPNLCVACFNATGDASHCPHCGWNAQSVPAAASHLIPGTVLGDSYIIGQVLGHGGFGITYLGWNHKLRIPVAIKEFLPDHIARRDANRTTISLYAGYDELFADGLIKFQEEAQALAKFQQHPGIITVYGTMTANGTGYMVMEYINGITLKQYLADTPGKKIPWADAIAIMVPVMDALRTVHAAKLLHRDIAPDNIYLTTDHRVKLLDFGAARQTIGEQSKSLSVILKEGFAPEEQYRRKGKQGPWTDVYGVAATLYHCIVGAVPLSALDRMSCDELKPPSALGIAIAPKHEAALMRGLAVRAEDRWQSMEEMQQQLVLEELPPPQPPPQKNNLWTIIAFMPIWLGIVGTTFAGLWLYHTMIVPPRQDTELDTRAFQAARTSHTEAAYQVYLAGCAANGCGFQAKAIDAIKSLAIHTELEKRDDAAFSQAQQDDTEASYQRYLDNCQPNGCKHKDQATKLREQRQRDDAAFSQAQQDDSETSYRQYLDNCQPNGCRHQDQATKLREQRQRDDDAFNQARQDDTKTSYQQYLDNCQSNSCKHTDQATELREQRQRDDAAFSQAQQDDTKTSYRRYLDNCQPTGCKYKDQANRKLITLIDKLLAQQRRDDEAFSRAQQDDTKTSYRQYLDNCQPNGCKHTDQAAELREQRQRDDTAFSQARQDDTKAGYQRYLDNCQSNGCKHKDQATKILREQGQRDDGALKQVQQNDTETSDRWHLTDCLSNDCRHRDEAVKVINNQYLSGDEIRALVSNKTTIGRTIAKKPQYDWKEYQSSDGTAFFQKKGQSRIKGNWEIRGNAVCWCYGRCTEWRCKKVVRKNGVLYYEEQDGKRTGRISSFAQGNKTR